MPSPVWLLPADDRPLGTQAWLLSAWAQAGWTLTLGTAAGGRAPRTDRSTCPFPLGPWTVLAGLAAASAVWWLLPRLARSPRRINRWLEARWGLESGRWTPQQHRGQIVLSGLRYAVFATQFAAALAAWGIEWDLALYTTIAVVYLGNMIVPTAAWPNSASARRSWWPGCSRRDRCCRGCSLQPSSFGWSTSGSPLIGGGLQFQRRHG